MTNYIHKIDKNNFYYNSITYLAYCQFGVNELFSRSFIIKALDKYKSFDNPEFIEYLHSFNFGSDVENRILHCRTFTPLIFVPSFTTKDKKSTYEMNPNDSSEEIYKDHGSELFKVNIELTHMTIVSAFEKISSLGLKGPVFEFFRHIRNAAAHNGKFHFMRKVLTSTGELTNPAEWSKFKIYGNMQGLKLICEDKIDEVAFFDQGDLVEFLLDFENQYPQIKS